MNCKTLRFKNTNLLAMLHSKRKSTVQKITLYHQRSRKENPPFKKSRSTISATLEKESLHRIITTLRSLRSRFIRINIKIVRTVSSLRLRKKHPNLCTETSDLAVRKKIEKTLKFCAHSSLGLRKI